MMNNGSKVKGSKNNTHLQRVFVRLTPVGGAASETCGPPSSFLPDTRWAPLPAPPGPLCGDGPFSAFFSAPRLIDPDLGVSVLAPAVGKPGVRPGDGRAASAGRFLHPVPLSRHVSAPAQPRAGTLPSARAAVPCPAWASLPPVLRAGCFLWPLPWGSVLGR